MNIASILFVHMLHENIFLFKLFFQIVRCLIIFETMKFYFWFQRNVLYFLCEKLKIQQFLSKNFRYFCSMRPIPRLSSDFSNFFTKFLWKFSQFFLNSDCFLLTNLTGKMKLGHFIWKTKACVISCETGSLTNPKKLNTPFCKYFNLPNSWSTLHILNSI